MKKYIDKITCADSLDVLRELDDKCIDLVLIDPVYRDESENQPTKCMRKMEAGSCQEN